MLYINKLVGHFDFANIKVIHSDTHYVPPRELGLKIDEVWNNAIEQFLDGLWDGVNYRLGFIEHDGTFITLCMSTAAYRCNYASSQLTEDIQSLSFSERPNCMYISTLLETTDNFFVLGKTASKGIHGSTIALIGGSLDENEMIISSALDLEDYLYREVQEELGVPRELIVFSEGLGIYEMPTSRIGIFVHTFLKISSAEFDTVCRMNEEHDGYVVVNAEDIMREKNNENTMYNRGVFLALEQLQSK